MPKYVLEEHPSDDCTEVDEFYAKQSDDACEKY